MDTYFAPAGRTERRKFRNQINFIANSPMMSCLLDAVNGLLVVLNEDRQVVAINHEFLRALGILDPEEVLGFRLGEVLHCIHAKDEPSGCGTTQYCMTCGAAIAMMAAIEKNVPDQKICALSARDNGSLKDLCLLITAKPLVVEEHRWILIYAQDITQQQFWASLEQVFFHDINNILTSIMGNTELLSLDFPKSDEVERIRTAVQRLGSEITLQRSLLQTKEVRYCAQKVETTLRYIREDVAKIVNGHRSLARKNLQETWPDKDILLFTDSMLVSRILGNMIINALEATGEQGRVRMTTQLDESYVAWEVWNGTVIPPEVQKRIFQRHFSTKSGTGRGLGTYSMKLFGEKYLGGEVSFVSSAANGTTFRFRLPRTRSSVMC